MANICSYRPKHSLLHYEEEERYQDKFEGKKKKKRWEKQNEDFEGNVNTFISQKTSNVMNVLKKGVERCYKKVCCPEFVMAYFLIPKLQWQCYLKNILDLILIQKEKLINK